MPRNIEAKARIADFEAARRIAALRSGGPPALLLQEDRYFAPPDGEGGGLVKLRLEEGRAPELIRYFRAESGDPRASDYQRIPVSGPEAPEVLALGTPRAIVRKRRELSLAGNVRIHLDVVEGLGHFLELEAMVDPDHDEALCLRRTDELLAAFGIARTALLGQSYSRLQHRFGPVPAVFVTYPLPGDALGLLSEARVEVHPGPYPIPRASLLTGAEFADALVVPLTDRIDEAVMAISRGRLRVIGNVAVGVDNVDLEAARGYGVTVVNTPGVLTEATAELTLALLLAVTRRVVEGDARIRSGRWGGWTLDDHLGTGLAGKTLGVVGLGRIGRSVARRAQAFGMQVVYHNRSPFPLSLDAELGVRALPLGELLATADVVSLHAPGGVATRHLVDAAALSRMKPGSFLVNTARGSLVEEAALVGALRSGHLAGAALDVFEHEPRVHPGLLELPQVVLAPHIGSATRETRSAMARLAVQGVADVLAGREPANRVATG